MTQTVCLRETVNNLLHVTISFGAFKLKKNHNGLPKVAQK